MNPNLGLTYLVMQNQSVRQINFGHSDPTSQRNAIFHDILLDFLAPLQPVAWSSHHKLSQSER